MARGRGADRRGRSKRGPPFVRLNHEVIDSPGYRALRPVARAALVEIARLYKGTNNGALPVSHRWLAERLGSDKKTAGSALRELEACGLVGCVRPSGFSVKNREGQAALYRLNWEPCHATGQPPSLAYRTAPERKSRGENPDPNGGKKRTRCLHAAASRDQKTDPTPSGARLLLGTKKRTDYLDMPCGGAPPSCALPAE